MKYPIFTNKTGYLFIHKVNNQYLIYQHDNNAMGNFNTYYNQVNNWIFETPIFDSGIKAYVWLKKHVNDIL